MVNPSAGIVLVSAAPPSRTRPQNSTERDANLRETRAPGLMWRRSAVRVRDVTGLNLRDYISARFCWLSLIALIGLAGRDRGQPQSSMAEVLSR